MLVKVEIIKKYADLKRNNRIYPIGDTFIVDKDRADDLVNKGLVKIIDNVYIQQILLDRDEIETAIPIDIVETTKLTKPKPKTKPKRNVKK